MTEITIRLGTKEEYKEIVELYSKAYQDRFFNPDRVFKCGQKILKSEIGTETIPVGFLPEFQEYSGNLGIPFSCLIPQDSGAGQSFESFNRYWQEKLSDPNFKVFVAEKDGKIIGFIKGTFEYVDCDLDFPDVIFPTDIDKTKIISIGSLYIDPDYRETGAGTKLVKYYMQEAIKEKKEYSGFITDCYWRNNSQYFFNKTGAESIGFCNIPDLYLDKQLQRQTQNIVGEVMFWSKDKVEELLSTSTIDKKVCLADIPYTRQTLMYSAMVVAGGNMEEYKKIMQENSAPKTWQQFVRKQKPDCKNMFY